MSKTMKVAGIFLLIDAIFIGDRACSRDMRSWKSGFPARSSTTSPSRIVPGATLRSNANSGYRSVKSTRRRLKR